MSSLDPHFGPVWTLRSSFSAPASVSLPMFLKLLDALEAEAVECVPTKFGVRPADKYMGARDLYLGVTQDQTKFYIGDHTGKTVYNVISRFDSPEAAARATVALLRERLGITTL